MKKYITSGIVALALIVSFSACNMNSSSPKVPTLKTATDSLNYLIGYANGEGMRNILEYRDVNDSTNVKIKNLIQGMTDGFNSNNNMAQSVGKDFGTWLNSQKKNGFLNDSTLKLNYELLRQGMINGVKGDSTNIGFTKAEANEIFGRLMQKRMEEQMNIKYAKEKEAAEQFMVDNGKKANIKTTESGLQYEIVKLGKGAKPSKTDNVKLHYEGKLTNGTVFDSSIARKEPTTFNVSQVIPGWTEGLQLMPVGSKFKFYIPYQLAYRAQGTQGIPPFSNLIFDVELLGIEK